MVGLPQALAFLSTKNPPPEVGVFCHILSGNDAEFIQDQ